MIGSSVKPRCFKTILDKRRLWCSYCSANKKSRMESEILWTVNRKCIAGNRKMWIFINNALSYSDFFNDCFSHIKVIFLPKKKTSKLQPLDTRIIKNFKVFYHKQLLQHVLARIRPGCKALYQKLLFSKT